MLLFDHRERWRIYNEVMTVKRTGAVLAEWAVHKIESEYADDVSLLLEHRTLRLDEDQEETSFSFYIPATSRANGLARTFIIAGIGYDLFPVSWERIERMAEVKEYNTTVLADAEILWARSGEDRERFTSLQARLAANLQNPHFMRNRAMEWLGTAVEVYQETLFEEAMPKVRENAGHICNLSAIAVACANGKYFRHGQTDQLKELSSMTEVPAGFTDLYERIIRAKAAEEQKRLCHDLIVSTKRFLQQHDRSATRRHQRAGLLGAGHLVSGAFLHVAPGVPLVRSERPRQRLSLGLLPAERGKQSGRGVCPYGPRHAQRLRGRRPVRFPKTRPGGRAENRGRHRSTWGDDRVVPVR